MMPKDMGSKMNLNVGTGSETNNDKLALYLVNRPKTPYFKGKQGVSEIEREL